MIVGRDGSGRGDVVEESAVLIEGDDEQAVVP